MNKQPLLILAICFILGIFFQDQILLGKTSIVIVVFICFGIMTSLFFQSWSLHKLRAILLALMFFLLGITLHSLHTFSFRPDVKSSKERITFKMSRKLNSTEKYKKYEIIAKIGNDEVNSILYISKSEEQLDFNHYYKALVFINKLKPPLYDFQFDYSNYLKRKNIWYQMYLSGDVLSVARTDLGFKELIQQQRLEVLQNIDSVNISAETREFLKGIILADRTEIDPSVIQDFSRSGLVHFLAISGTHIMVIFGLFYFLLKLLLPLKLRKYTVIVSLVFIWLFATFIGFGNSVVRSCTMLTVYFIYVLLQRKPDVLHSMALSAFVILCIDSQQLFNIGFQLSFTAVLGIFWLNQPLLKCFPKQDNYMKKLIFNTISISVAAQLATIPLVLYYFHQFSLSSIFANFIIVPFSELIIMSSFCMTSLFAFTISFDCVNTGYDMMVKGLLKCVHWFASFDIFFIENISMSLIEVFILFLLVYLLRFAILKFNFENRMKLIILVLVFFITRYSFDIIENQRQEVLVHHIGKDKVLSVKNGSTAFFWITDNSNREKIIRYIVNPYSSSRRLKRIELKNLDKLTKKIIYNGKIYDIN
ncbi:ComEC/Rec2 family competence protein [Chryseobacterium sp. YIM B02567]|uniref:ComEC/Rec2 family competence protein n=1 Tax=Chryseobacterium paridis TaxID=2800328 RepID=A0ABS1G0F0_9FLAO|nr:ComEC/Rec2 family competence protein [Chryseobacterium paridis]